jgi:hypothetical protein
MSLTFPFRPPLAGQLHGFMASPAAAGAATTLDDVRRVFGGGGN